MRKFRFVGNGNSDPETLDWFGYKFRLNGDGVAVDERLAFLLESNSHFREVKTRVRKKKVVRNGGNES